MAGKDEKRDIQVKVNGLSEHQLANAKLHVILPVVTNRIPQKYLNYSSDAGQDEFRKNDQPLAVSMSHCLCRCAHGSLRK